MRLKGGNKLRVPTVFSVLLRLLVGVWGLTGEPGEASHSSVCQAKGSGLDIQLLTMRAKRASLRSTAVNHGLWSAKITCNAMKARRREGMGEKREGPRSKGEGGTARGQGVGAKVVVYAKGK